jgi:hypothetical protein
MRSTVVAPSLASIPLMLTTLERVKSELSITTTANDNLLSEKIAEASSAIEAYLGYTLTRQSVTETFWQAPIFECPEYLILNRTPVAQVTSVTVDDVAVESSRWRLDPETGLLYALDASGYPSRWEIAKALVIAYSGGWALPEDTASDLPAAIQAAAVDLISSFWSARGRDTTVKAEEIPGVMRREYWVGSIAGADSGDLPPSALSKLAPFRRPSV